MMSVIKLEMNSVADCMKIKAKDCITCSLCFAINATQKLRTMMNKSVIYRTRFIMCTVCLNIRIDLRIDSHIFVI
jgi:hypothetical protein